MAEDDAELPSIHWADHSAECSPNEREVDESLRIVARRLPGDLSRDVVFWLDLGRPPREVAHWLRLELERCASGPGAVESADHSADESHAKESARSPSAAPGWVVRRRRASRSRRRAPGSR